MKSHSYTSLSDVTNLLSKSCLCSENRLKDSSNEQFTESLEDADIDESLDLDDLEEVFTDHILMDKRLRKTLYAGNFCGLENLPDHPPIALTGLALEIFSKAAPNYGLDILDMDYVSAASEAARISPCAMIIAMIYLERLQLKNSEYLENVSPPGLFVVTMLVASKFLFEDEEDIATNQMWAEALNFDIKDLNTLEREFLSAIDWKVFVDSSEYLGYLYNVEKVIAVKQSSLRNWLSYSDMYVLCQDPAFHLWKTFLKKIVEATLFCTLGYAATAFVLYNTTLAFQKLKIEKHSAPSLTVGNDTTEMQNSALISMNSLYVEDKFFPNTENVDDFSQSSSSLDLSNEKPTSYALQNKNCYSTMATVKRKVASVYTVKITKVFSPQKFQFNPNYFLLKNPVLNNSYSSSEWSTVSKSLCASILMR